MPVISKFCLRPHCSITSTFSSSFAPRPSKSRDWDLNFWISSSCSWFSLLSEAVQILPSNHRIAYCYWQLKNWWLLCSTTNWAFRLKINLILIFRFPFFYNCSNQLLNGVLVRHFQSFNFLHSCIFPIAVVSFASHAVT